MLTFSLYQGLGRFPIHLNNIFFMINLLLPGTSVIYYGDEIGMSNNATDLKWSEVQDPYTTNSLYCNQTQFEKDECICRDPSRTPMQVTGKFKTLYTVVTRSYATPNYAIFAATLFWIESKKTRVKLHIFFFFPLVKYIRYFLSSKLRLPSWRCRRNI